MSVSRSFLAPFAAAVVIVLAMVASINAAVDINGVYHNRQGYAERYVDALIGSEHGLVLAPYERLVKFELLRRTMPDCYIFGSSHIMTVNLERFAPIATRCKELFNLGVSSATFEDFVIFMSELSTRKPGTRVYFEIPAWFLEENENVRWTELSDAYDRAVALFRLPGGSRYSSAVSRALNLVSASYLNRNVGKIMRDGKASYVEPPIRSAWPPQALDPDDAVLGRDGSLTYSVLHDGSLRQIGNGDLFATPLPLISQRNAREAEIVVRALEQQGIRLVPVLIPYNPLRWRCEASSTCGFLQASESASKALFDRLGLQVVGSYDPRPLGLTQADFYDDQHVVIESLPKLAAAMKPALERSP